MARDYITVSFVVIRNERTPKGDGNRPQNKFKRFINGRIRNERTPKGDGNSLVCS